MTGERKRQDRERGEDGARPPAPLLEAEHPADAAGDELLVLRRLPEVVAVTSAE
jgi:hypothetical protein